MKKLGLIAAVLLVIGGGLLLMPTKTDEAQAQAQTPQAPSVLTFANFRDIRDLNPHLYSGELYAQNMLFESLSLSTMTALFSRGLPHHGLSPKMAQPILLP